MTELIFYFALYIVAGASLKLGDDLIDEIKKPRFAWGPLTLSGVTFGLLMSYSEWDLVLLTSMIIGVVITGKVNRPQFISGFVTIGIVLSIFGVPKIANYLSWSIILLFIISSAAVDEWGNDWIEKEKGKWPQFLFKHRFTMKIVVVLIGLWEPSFVLTAIGLWIFDMGYEMVSVLTRRHLSKHAGMQDYSKHQ